jgi:hypothetical protein
MESFVRGEKNLPLWVLGSDMPGDDHIHELNIPLLGDRPSLLLHDLGGLAQTTEVARRLSSIFSKDQYMSQCLCLLPCDDKANV